MSETSMFFNLFGKDMGVGTMFEKVAGHGKGVSGALVGIGAAAAGMGIVRAAEGSVKAFEDTAKAAGALRRETGGTAEDSSRLGYALSAVGIAAEDVAKPIGIFSKNLVHAGQDAGKHAEMVNKLGFEYLDANGKVLPLTEVLPKLSDRFKEMPNGAEKTTLALELFGRAGAAMIPFLNQGTEAMQEQMVKSDELGLTLSGPQVDAARHAALAQKEWDNTLRGLNVTIGSMLMPVLEVMKEFLRGQVAPAIEGVVHWFKSLSPEMQQWVTVLGMALLVGGPLLLILGKFAGAISSVIGVVQTVKEAWIGLNIVMNANFIAVVVIAIAAFVASLIWAYNNIGWFKDFVDSAFHIIGDVITAVIGFITGTIVPSLVNAWNNVQGTTQAVTSFVSDAWNNVSSTVSNIVQNIISFFENLGTNAQNTWNGLVSGVQSAVGQVGEFFGSLPGRILGAIGDLGGLLVGVGAKLIGGLTAGIQGALGGLGDVLGAVGSFIAEHKGPEEYDRQLLVPHGGWIMGGLIKSIGASMPALGAVLGGVGDMISGAVQGASVSIDGTLSGRTGAATMRGVDNARSGSASLDLHGLTLELNADATKAMFKRTAAQSAQDAVDAANDDLYRGRAR